MPQYTAVLTAQSYKELQAHENAMARGAAEIARPGPDYPAETLALANSLLLQLPGFDWTIEVDILGRHRVTVHFEGGTIAIDE